MLRDSAAKTIAHSYKKGVKQMADINERKREDNDAGKAVGSGVGAFRGDTMASALDPFGAAAGAVASGSRTTRRGKVPLMTTIMVPKKRRRIKWNRPLTDEL